jgi:hypothetical protein
MYLKEIEWEGNEVYPSGSGWGPVLSSENGSDPLG